jgi:membrane-anchored glycerophosphoryl diester phosphodiesterase (GDPDase)
MWKLVCLLVIRLLVLRVLLFHHPDLLVIRLVRGLRKEILTIHHVFLYVESPLGLAK